MNWYVIAKKNTAVIPENWDVAEHGPGDKDSYNHWRLWSGANDWETGVTLMAITYGQHNHPGQKRLWVEVNNSQFPKKNNNDQPKEITDKVREWGKKAIATWIEEFRKIESQKHEYEHCEMDSFLDALKSKAMKQFIKKWGIDELTWEVCEKYKK